MTKEIEEKVMMMTQDIANRLKQQSGVEPSLTDNEIKTILDKVLEEACRMTINQVFDDYCYKLQILITAAQA